MEEEKKNRSQSSGKQSVVSVEKKREHDRRNIDITCIIGSSDQKELDLSRDEEDNTYPGISDLDHQAKNNFILKQNP